MDDRTIMMHTISGDMELSIMALKRRYVVPGSIVKKSSNSESYKVKLKPPGSNELKVMTFSVEDFTSAVQNQKMVKKSNPFSKYYITLTSTDRTDMLTEQGYSQTRIHHRMATAR